MAVSVEFTYYVCEWCGAPFGVPTSLANNSRVAKLCPSGHNPSDGRVLMDLVKNARDERDSLKNQVIRQSKYISQLKGQITRLQKKAR